MNITQVYRSVNQKINAIINGKIYTNFEHLDEITNTVRQTSSNMSLSHKITFKKSYLAY